MMKRYLGIALCLSMLLTLCAVPAALAEPVQIDYWSVFTGAGRPRPCRVWWTSSTLRRMKCL